MAEIEDAKLARRLRIANALIALGFLGAAAVIGLIEREVFAAVFVLTLFAAGSAIGICYLDSVGLLPGGRLSARQRRAVPIMLTAAAVLAVAA